MSRSTKCKLISSLILLLLNTVCALSVYFFDLESTPMKVIGSYIAVLLSGMILIKFPLRFNIFMHIFVFFASSLGSCMNLYRYIEDYDVIIHFFSGIVLAEGGKLLADIIFDKKGLKKDRSVITAFSFLFSCTSAALWEIYEYSVDVFLNGNMQGSKENTMNDIVAGVSGALIYAFLNTVLISTSNRKRKRRKESNKNTVGAV